MPCWNGLYCKSVCVCFCVCVRVCARSQCGTWLDVAGLLLWAGFGSAVTLTVWHTLMSHSVHTAEHRVFDSYTHTHTVINYYYLYIPNTFPVQAYRYAVQVINKCYSSQANTKLKTNAVFSFFKTYSLMQRVLLSSHRSICQGLLEVKFTVWLSTIMIGRCLLQNSRIIHHKWWKNLSPSYALIFFFLQK